MYGISFVLPCHNSGKFLAEVVESILIQPFHCSYEIVIIDDGSSDPITMRWLSEYEINPRIRVIRLGKNHGVQHARSMGVTESIFDYIQPIDSDDCLATDPGLLAKGTLADLACSALESDKGIAFAYSISKMFDQFTGYTISAYPISVREVVNKHHVQTSIVYRKTDALDAGLYNLQIEKWQDWSFAVALLNSRFSRGWENKIHFVPRPYFQYRIHDQAGRISAKDVSEYEMTRITVASCSEIFSSYYPNLSADTIARLLLERKPSRLVDLLHIASFDLSSALRIAAERELVLTAKAAPHHVP